MKAIVRFVSLVSVALSVGFAQSEHASNGPILFESRGDIYLADPGSGQARKVGAQGGQPTWSPDGRRIAFISNPYRTEGVPSELYVVNRDGTELKKLTTGIDGATTPAWSPDGNKIAFVDFERRTQTSELYVIDSDGSDLSRLVDAERPTLPRWSPDGGKLLYLDRLGSVPDLFVFNLGDRLVRRLVRRVNSSWIAWSPDGSLISFGRHGRLRVARADGTGARRLSNLHVFGHHSWSPDGSLIAFEHRQGGRYPRSDIYTVRPDGSDLRRLTRGSDRRAEDLHPAWSPDGSQLAFTSSRSSASGGPREVYVMNSDGSCETKLSEGAWVMHALGWQARPPTSSSLRCVDLRVAGDVDVTDDRVSRDVDRQYLYRITVVNDGNLPGSRIRLGVPPAREATFLSASTSQGSCTVDTSASCDLRDLQPNETREVTIRFRILLRTRRNALIGTVATAAATETDVDAYDNQHTLSGTFPFCRAPDSESGTLYVWPWFPRSICGSRSGDRIGGSNRSEAVYGSGGNDVLRGRGGEDYLDGGNGQDELQGGPGADTGLGGSGSDLLEGGRGSDRLLGSRGNDLLLVRDQRRDHVYCGEGRDRVVADRKDAVSRDCERVSRQ